MHQLNTDRHAFHATALEDRLENRLGDGTQFDNGAVAVFSRIHMKKRCNAAFLPAMRSRLENSFKQHRPQPRRNTPMKILAGTLLLVTP